MSCALITVTGLGPSTLSEGKRVPVTSIRCTAPACCASATGANPAPIRPAPSATDTAIEILVRLVTFLFIESPEFCGQFHAPYGCPFAPGPGPTFGNGRIIPVAPA